jgi:WD40 repeat protein
MSATIKYYKILSEYYAGKPLYLDESVWKTPNTRKLVEQPWQQTRGENWDDVIDTLCDLYFIEAKCMAGMTFVLINDYHLALEKLPERQTEVEVEVQRLKQVVGWTKEIIEYASKWSERRDQMARRETETLTEPQMPEVLPSCRIWTQEEIDAECKRILETPTRFDLIKAFSNFVELGSYALLEFAGKYGFVLQYAYNYAAEGPVHTAAWNKLKSVKIPSLLQKFNENKYNPKPAIVQLLEGHTNTVSSVSITPDGRTLVSGSNDNTLKVWDLENGKCLCTLNHKHRVECVWVSPDGKIAISGGHDKILRVWDIATGVCIQTLTGHADEIKSVSVTPDGRRAVSGGFNNTLRVWDLGTGKCTHILENKDKIGHCCVNITPDGRFAVTGRGVSGIPVEEPLKIWEIDSGTVLHALGPIHSAIECLCITHDGRKAITGNGILWDLEAETSLSRMSGIDGRGVSITPDGRIAVAPVSRTSLLKIWDPENDICCRVLEGHTNYVQCISMTPDGYRAVSGGYDNTIMVWNLQNGKSFLSAKPQKDWINGISISPDGRKAVMYSGDKMPSVWDVKTGECISVFEGRTSEVTNVYVTPDCQQAVSLGRDRTVRVWELTSGHCQRIVEGQDGMYPISIKPGGKHAIFHDRGIPPKDQFTVVQGGTYSLEVRDIDSGQCLHTLKGHAAYVECVRYTLDGHRMITGSQDKTLRVWDMVSGDCMFILKGHGGNINCLTVTGDNRYAVSGSYDRTLRVWDMESGNCLRILEGHTGVVGCVEVIPDTHRAVSIGNGGKHNLGGDGTIRIWDIISGECLHTLKGHTLSVNCIKIAPNGLWAATGSWDKTLRVWDLESGQCIAVFRGSVPISSIDILPCGSMIICGTGTGEIKFLELHNVGFNNPISDNN